jgi:hypothetical protein
MPWPMFQWRRHSPRLWMICGLFAVVYLLWDGRRLARRAVGREGRGIDEFRCAVAPLVVYALMWLLADSAQPPNAQVRLS